MTDQIKHGDYVRVTIEGPHLTGPSISVGTFKGDEREWDAYSTEKDTVTVERIDPPVEVFKPGHVVRSRCGNTYTLTNTGYVSHQTGTVWNDGAGWRDNEFTSEKYERVNLNGR